jgi:hypothetical protein
VRPIKAFLASGRASAAPITSDDFSSNTIGSYTARQDSGTPTWTIASGELTFGATLVGTQATLTRNGFSAADAYVEADMGGANDAGLVLRLADQNNFYLLTISDDSGTNPTANFRIFKRVAGTFTQLGSSVNLAWTRGTSKVIKFSIAGSTIKAFMDSVEQLSVTDSAITAAGLIGMRSNATGDAFQALRWG